MKTPLKIQSVVAHVFRSPLSVPVQTSFGKMFDRPMVLVSITNDDGLTGWGEVWCNFPGVGAEHRARLIDSIFAPLLVGNTFESPEAVFEHLSEATSVLAIQSGEFGPFAQSIAGLDTAAWDLAGQMAGLPLWRLLGGTNPRIGVYASGLNPDSPEFLATDRFENGFRAFKLKIGFGQERDLVNLTNLRSTLPSGSRLMVDANQGWSVAEAISMLPMLERFDLDWLEEPLRADRPWSEWEDLQKRTAIPLAAGENIMGDDAFDAALDCSALSVIQPDLAKWGGLSRCLPLAKRIIQADKRFCPHYLGGGVGLVASAHLLAASGGDGMLEIDANPNPLRSILAPSLGVVDNGHTTLTDTSGLGVTPDLESLAQFAVSAAKYDG